MHFSVKLNQNRDFQRLYKRAKSYASPILVTYCLPSRQKINRFGVTTSRKIGKAVMRNRARRVIVEAYRQLEQEITPGWDFVFVARTRTTLQKTEAVRAMMHKHLSAAGAIRSERP